jgi:hypothetical protein
MLSEVATVLDPYNVILVMRILVSQVRYYIQFNLCLVLELFVVPYYFDCNGFVCFVIIAFDCLPK